MSKEKLTINNLLTWKDIINLGDPVDINSFHIGGNVCYDCCKSKRDANELEENCYKYIDEPFHERFTDCPISLLEMDIRFCFYKDDNDNWKIKYSIPFFIASLYGVLHPEDVDKKILKEISEEVIKYPEDAKDIVVRLLKDAKKAINEVITAMDSFGMVKQYNKYTGIETENNKNNALSRRKIIMWFIKNIDSVLEYLDRDFPIQVLDVVDKDKFLLYLVTAVGFEKVFNNFFTNRSKIDSLKDELESTKVIFALRYANNYMLLIDYINSENMKDSNYLPYDVTLKISSPEKEILLSSNRVLSDFKPLIEYARNLAKDNVELKERLGLYESYEELLQAKASDTWKKIENARLVDSIKVGFEMIKAGSKIKLDREASIKRNTATSNSEKVGAKLKRDYDLLDQKLDYYGKKEPVVELVGICNFVGYFAQFFENGCVVLDKYYRYGKDRRGKETVYPAREEGIYVMNYREFANLCTYTKPELIEEVKFNNPDIIRKNHSVGWQSRVDKVIEGNGYGGLDLDFLDQLVKSLSGNSNQDSEKVYRK